MEEKFTRLEEMTRVSLGLGSLARNVIADFRPEITSGVINGEIYENNVSFNHPLLIVRKDDCSFSENMTDEDKKKLLGKIELIKSKIQREIKE